MVNLRELVESDLETSLEGEFGLPVELTDPDGVIYTTKKGSTDLLTGQILYDTVLTSPETLEQMTVNEPIVSLRRSSLTRIPLAGETWGIRIPTSPSLSAPMEDFILTPTRAPEGGASIGFIKLYPQRAIQTP
jgi:hypothetical protein